MEIRIGITQVARELMVEVSSDALVAKAREAITAALNGKSEMLSITDDKGRVLFEAKAHEPSVLRRLQGFLRLRL